VQQRGSSSVPDTSYRPGVVAADVREVLDAGGVPLADKLSEALVQFNDRMRGYLTDEAVLIGVESRSSSPVRVLRDAGSLQSPSLAGLYPCGEGAGYAGGIVSAAVDGMRVAEQIVAAGAG
jgi:uncharacterized FAD-dependent dehydrogenase